MKRVLSWNERPDDLPDGHSREKVEELERQYRQSEKREDESDDDEEE